MKADELEAGNLSPYALLSIGVFKWNNARTV